MAPITTKTARILKELGAHEDCPVYTDPNPTGFEYDSGLSVTLSKLTCTGNKKSERNLHPTCKQCKIRGQEFPDYGREAYKARIDL
ncbi:MAG: hypothetical protein ABIG28_01490 [archaeon]